MTVYVSYLFTPLIPNLRNVALVTISERDTPSLRFAFNFPHTIPVTLNTINKICNAVMFLAFFVGFNKILIQKSDNKIHSAFIAAPVSGINNERCMIYSLFSFLSSMVMTLSVIPCMSVTITLVPAG